MAYRSHDEVTVSVAAEPAQLFDFLDDQERLAAHMAKPSMMMMGGRMAYEFDATKGRALGSVIRMRGDFLWLRLFVEEVVTDHKRPTRKVWRTRGVPKLLIIGGYTMGFEIDRDGNGSSLRVFIDYDRPKTLWGRMLGAPVAPLYARWCVDRMANDAKAHFEATASPLLRPE